MIAATPFVAVGVAWGFSETRSRFLVLVGLIPIPLVVAFQFKGGAAPQWAGRYLLLSGFLVAVVGIAERRRMAQWARVGFVAASVAITAFGLLWLSERSRDVADAAALLNARSESVLISPNGFIPREFGATYGQKDWLASGSSEDLAFAVDVVARSGRADFGLVDLDTTGDPPTFAGWEAVGSETVPFIAGAPLRVTTYERTGPAG
jgi:hypothetical protein